jgi:ankyrin repeat protein
MSEASQSGGAQILVSDDEIGSGIAGFAPADDSPPEEDREAACARSAVSLVRVLEGDIRRDNAVFPGPLYIYPVTGESPEFSRNLASRALYVRARLGHLTGDPLQPPGSQWDAELQGVARRLQTALQDAAGYIFRDAPLKDGGWKRAKALTWSAACELTIHTLGVSLSSAFPIHFIMRQQGQRWLIDEYLLAAVMGLWRYSILNSARHADIHMFASRQYPKRKFIEAAISLEHTAAVVRLWVTKDSALEHASYESPRPELGAPTFMLSTDTSMGALSPSSTQWEPYRDGQFAGQDHAERSGVLLLSVQTRASLLEMMAQDIFSTFMFETASIMDNLSEVCVRQQPGSSGESILRNPNATSSELGNVHIDTLARILCDSGLATEEAALMSIVPTFFHHGKLPSLDASIASLLNDAKQLRSDGQYQQGEAHLKSLLRICSPDHHEKVVRALGELCREASRSPSEFHRDFGLRAMASLRQLTRQGVTALSEPAVTALKDYQQLSEILKEDPRHSGKPWEAKPPPPLDMTSVAELRQDMELPRDKRPRLKALLMLEKYDIGGRNSLAVQEFLFVAIALGYAEVIEDLRALNPSLLFELPFSEVPSGEGEPLTVVVQKKFNPGGEAEFLDSNGKEPKGSLRPGAPIVFLATVWAASQLEQEDRAPGEAEDVLRTMLSWASITNDLTDGQKNTPLMYAVSSGNLAAVDILLEYGVDFQVRNTAGETALSRAVANDCLSIAESILKEGQRAGGLSHGYLHHALALAFRLRKREFIEILLRHGADINELDERGKTLLLAAMEPFLADAAAVQNQPHIIKIWRRRDGRGSGDPKLVSLLIEYGAMVGQEVLGVMLQTALDIVEPDWIRQLHARDYNVVGWLNEKGALAAVLEHPEDGHYAQPLVKVLLELGVTVQPGDVNLAVRFPSRDGILDLVLETRPPTDGVLKDYGTPVQTVLNNTSWPSGYAPEQEKKLEILIAAGCDVNLDSPEWKASPLQIICARSTLYTQPLAKFPEVAVASKDNLASILLRAGAKTNLTAADIPGEEGRVIRSTPLELACLTGKADLVQALLDAGADVNAPGGEFGSPLQAACMQFGQRNEDSVAIIRTLLAAGANVNAISAPCGTALAAATHSLLPDVVQVLLDAGANPSLEITDHASGAYYDAWDALHQPHGRLIESLRETFKGMQTGPFTCIPLSYDSAGGRWELIRKLLTQHGGGAIRPGMEEKACPAMYLQERVQTICAQDEFKRLSPEEIRWRHRWRPNQTSAAPRADAADSKSPTDPLPFYGFIGLGGGVGKEPVAVQHISSQHPYHEHSAEEVRLWDYDAGLRYPPKKSSQTPEEKVTHGFSLDIEVVPSVFSSTSVQRGGFGSFGTDNNAPTGLFGSSSGGGLFRSAGFRVTPQAGSSGQGGFGGAAGGLSGTGTSGGSLFGTAPSGGLSRAASTSGGSLFGGNSLLDWLSGTGDSSGTSLFGSSSGQGGLFRLPTTPTRSSSLFGSSSVGTGFGTSSASATPFGPGTGQGELADASSGLSIGSSLEHGGLSTGGLDASDSAQAGLVGKGPGAGPVGSDPIGVGAENIEGPLQVPCDDADLASTVSKILESTVEIRKADSEA